MRSSLTENLFLSESNFIELTIKTSNYRELRQKKKKKEQPFSSAVCLYVSLHEGCQYGSDSATETVEHAWIPRAMASKPGLFQL